MWLSRLELRADAPERLEFWREVASPGGAHKALWKVFARGPVQTRDFLFRHDEGRARGAGRVRFYVLSHQPPASDGGGLWSVETKPFAPVIEPGDRLAFSLRASPTVKRSAGRNGADSPGQGRRHDVVQDLRLRAKSKSEPIELVDAVREAGLRWLNAKAERAGFEVSSVAEAEDDGMSFGEEARSPIRIDGYRQHRVPRPGGSPIRFSTLDFEGVLVVRDPARFIEQVKVGFGPQKAFGCGLMLLRRA